MCICLSGALGAVLWGLRQGGQLLCSRLRPAAISRRGAARRTQLICQLLCALAAVVLILALGAPLAWFNGGLG
jgi:hypothetical protein